MSTDLWQGALINGHIWHARRGAAENAFRYRAVYLALPVSRLEAGLLPLVPDRPGLWALRRRDYGRRDGSSLSAFIAQEMATAGLCGADVVLVTLARTAGYGFNPVSFWLARQGGALRAVLAEVSNTFGERHFYLVRHPDLAPITPSDRIAGEKLFHVSPFLPREGRYLFRFDAGPARFGAWIDWQGAEGGDAAWHLAGRPRPPACAGGAQPRRPVSPVSGATGDGPHSLAGGAAFPARRRLSPQTRTTGPNPLAGRGKVAHAEPSLRNPVSQDARKDPLRAD